MSTFSWHLNIFVAVLLEFLPAGETEYKLQIVSLSFCLLLLHCVILIHAALIQKLYFPPVAPFLVGLKHSYIWNEEYWCFCNFPHLFLLQQALDVIFIMLCLSCSLCCCCRPGQGSQLQCDKLIYLYAGFVTGTAQKYLCVTWK